MAFRMLLITSIALLLGAGVGTVQALNFNRSPGVLKYYLQQQFGGNELLMVPAARAPVNGSFAGFGLEVVYEFIMTEEASPQSTQLGYVRGTAIVVNNSASGNTFFVQNVIHYNSGNRQGTLTQQGEAIFEDSPYEFAITGGTGIFRNVHGYNVGRFVSATPTPNGTHITTYYEASLSYFNDCH
ncbi:hypothetical protein KP509_17G052200 [Ceratopteris richardii]|uniref:Dirigent protein n=1 Tax=Ceratopteris richardii TaxID=49495 RepID=A0A8T2SVS6_CERRI|nr:hypothetical protein KP509_17G052200 [Ceratopteris richardii]